MIYYLYRFGTWLGVFIIATVSLWDILKYGVSSVTVFWQYSIGYKGVMLIWLGIISILGSLWASGKVKKVTAWNAKYVPWRVIPK